MSVEVAVPTLTVLTLSGSGNIVVGGIAAESLEVTLPGSGTLTGKRNRDTARCHGGRLRNGAVHTARRE